MGYIRAMRANEPMSKSADRRGPSGPETTPSSRRPQAWSEVYEALQGAILLGRLRPRERLVEDDLILRFEVTRHAVRRALDELEREGLVLRQPNRGVQVRDYSHKEVEDLYEIRTALETLAAARVRVPADPAFLAELRALAETHRDASRAKRYLELSRLNNAFHEKLYSGAGNPELSAAIRHYSVMTQPIRTRGFANMTLRETAIDEHFSMIAAIEGGELDTLVSLCRDHIRWPKDFYLRSSEPGEGDDEVPGLPAGVAR